jgi:SnoaL-like domain
MQEHEVRALFERLIEAMDPALEHEARHEDFIAEFPQSGERLDRDGLRRLQEHFPSGAPKIQLRRLTGSGDVWFGESRIEYNEGTVAYGVSRIEFRDGKIFKETRYYAEPFDPPAWRASWSRRTEEPVAG